MSGRKERSYNEYEYRMEYLGKVHSNAFTDLNRIKVEKHIPVKHPKTIDSQKILY